MKYPWSKKAISTQQVACFDHRGQLDDDGRASPGTGLQLHDDDEGPRPVPGMVPIGSLAGSTHIFVSSCRSRGSLHGDAGASA